MQIRTHIQANKELIEKIKSDGADSVLIDKHLISAEPDVKPASSLVNEITGEEKETTEKVT